jgi:CPA1 family monovalent cation:H+ antiporter
MNIPELMGQILGLCSIALGGVLINRITRLDVTLASLLSGVIAGIIIPLFDLDIGLRAHHIQDLVFFVILPVLIFEAAWHIKPQLLRRWLLPILLLATLGVLISAGVMGAGLYLGIGHSEGFPWTAALLTGAILAATDPVAVVSKLRNSKAPEELTTLFEGESLFNDATAVVLFGIVLVVAQGETASVSATSYFFTVFFGGIVVGLVAGLLLAIAVLFVGQKPASALILVFGAFASFFVAEHFFHVSGIMAVVTTAILARICLREQEHTFISGVTVTWDWLGLLLNTMLFALMGLAITFEMFREQWLAMLIAIAAALTARFVSVYFCALLTRLTSRPISMDWSLVLAWGGLRGTIAIALVLSLPVSLGYWWTVQSMVFGVVLFTLLVQGPTTGHLIRRISS